MANLLTARGAGRETEIALRTALGAGRGRLVRQLLTESVALAVLGGVLGVGLAFWGVEFLLAHAPSAAPRLDMVSVDARVLVFALAVSVLTGILFGLLPARQGARVDLTPALKEGGRGSGSGARRSRARDALAVAEVAVSLVLLVGAGLLARSFLELARVDPGFRPEGVLTANLFLPSARYPERQDRLSFYTELLERLEGLPGVESAGAVSSLPLIGPNSDADILVEGRPPPDPGEEITPWYRFATTGYFQTMGIRLVRGRVFTEADDADAANVVIVNETMARRVWPGEDAIGKRINTRSAENPNWREVVGVVADTRHFGPAQDPRMALYLPHRQIPISLMHVVVRTAGDPADLAGAVRREIWSLDDQLAIAGLRPLRGIVGDALAQPRFFTTLLGIFAAVALTLAIVGLYGVLSFLVAQRSHEVGVRLALGADAGDVMRLVVGRGLALTGAGLVIGIAGAALVTRLMSSLLFGVAPTDPPTFVAVSMILVAVATAACWIPARRAARLDPVEVLRHS